MRVQKGWGIQIQFLKLHFITQINQEAALLF